MKKLVLFALVALCVSMTQAVTLNWTNTGLNNSYDKLAVCLCSSETAMYFGMYSITVENDTITGFKDFLGNAWTGPESGGLTAVIASYDGTSWGGIYDGKATSGVLEVFGGNAYTEACLTDSWSDGASLVFIGYNADGTQAYLGAQALSAEQVNNLKTTVPEPTALALLALGVAGLALKRKHA